MRDIEIKIDENGYAKYMEHFIGNQYENEATCLVFDLPSGYIGKGYYQYAVFTLSNDKAIVRKIVDSKCIIDRDITNVAGLTLVQVIVKNIEGADDLSDGIVVCSQPISCYIKPSSYNSNKITNESIDKNIIVLLDEFDALLSEIRTIDTTMKNYKNELDKTIADISDNTTDLAEVIDARGNFTTLGVRLNAKPYYFDSVANMKASNLKAGDYAITTGYHNVNDGGGANYLIRIKTDNDVDNNGVIHFLDNGLVAELIIVSESVNVLTLGAIGNGETDNTEILTYCFKNFKSLYFPKGKYVFNGNVRDAISTNIEGNNAEIITNSTNGYDYMVIFKDLEKINISNIKFNSNNIGRGCISIVSIPNVVVENCEFTGYSNVYGYYETDSCLHINSSEFVNISNCYIHDTGYELENEVLNRGITTEDCDLVKIRNCKFDKVNQAIVTLNNKTIVDNCIFDYVKDNNIYNLRNDNKGLRGELICTSNYFSNRYDEGIVTSGKVNIISNNIFDNVPNCIDINSSMDSVIVINNVFQNVQTKEGNHGVVISARDESYELNDVIFKNNTIDIPVQCNDNGQILHFPIVARLSFTDNIINFYAISYGRGIYLKEVEYLIFTNNFMTDKNNTGNSNAFSYGTAPKKQVITGNYLGSLRVVANNSQNLEYVTTNMTPYLQTHNSNKMYTGTCVPTAGTWSRGDVIFNKLPSVGGNIGWICVEDGTPGTWKPMAKVLDE